MKTKISTQHQICLILLSLVISSCEPLFSPQDNSISAIKNYQELENAVGGVYDLFDLNISYGYTASIMLGDDQSVAQYNLLYSDAYNRKQDPIPGYAPENGSELNDEQTWRKTYQVIVSVNNIISQFEKKLGNNKQTNELVGEMYFIRAYCYFRLVRDFGQIPIIKDIDVNYQTEKSDFEEIYKFIESDLVKSMAYLPSNSNECRIQNKTPHRGTIKAFLAEVYLSWAGYPLENNDKYKLATSIAKEVIDSASYFGYELIDDFIDLWNATAPYNKEGVFCFHYNRSSHTQLKSEFNYSIFYESQFHIGPPPNLFGPHNTSYVLSKTKIPEINFFNSYPKGYRKDITFWKEIYIPSRYAENRALLDTGIQHIEIAAPYNRVAYRKFVLDTLGLPIFSPMNQDVATERIIYGNPKSYLLRYAQTLLTYAEATARAGEVTTLAYDCINKIRRRANNFPLNNPSKHDLQPGLSSQAFADSVFKERGWELAGEPNGRWYDVLRMNKVQEMHDSRDQNEGYLYYFKNFSENNYFRPIPEYDMYLNPNLGE